MTRRTHIAAGCAILSTADFNRGIFIFLVGLSGVFIPDFDIRFGLKHRTITHSLLGLGICTYILYKIGRIEGVYFSLAYLSHLLLDWMTVRGIPWLYPFSKKNYSLKITKTGSILDTILFVVLVMMFFKNVISRL